MGVFRRFYRVRPLSALLLCLPGIVVGVWFGWAAFSRLDIYRRLTATPPPLTLEDFQLSLHDALTRDVRRMSTHEPPQPSPIETFSFQIKGSDSGVLDQGALKESKRPYAKALLEVRGAGQKPRSHDVKLRLRGQRHWHILGDQRSLKVKMSQNTRLHGHRVFNVINDPTPLMVGEPLVLGLAETLGVLTPDTRFVRVRINQADRGVFLFESQPDESLLRRQRRFPGSMYSGNLPPSAATEELWRSAARWKKVAWRIPGERDDFSELEALLALLNRSTVSESVAFARRWLNLEAFAAFEAIDVAFGGEEHDFRQNHKLYFDPYRGRWEPVAWSFRGFRHQPRFNLVENPLSLRLKLVPEYLTLRNRILYDLLSGPGSSASVQERGLAILRELGPELAADPFWDAYKLLPELDSFHRRMLRPMTLQKLGLVFESEMITFAERQRYLLRALKRNPLFLFAGPFGDDPAGASAGVQVIVDGPSGVRLTAFSASFPADCRRRSWQVFREGFPITPPTDLGRAELDHPLELQPRVSFQPSLDPAAARSPTFAELVPAAYPFIVRAGCPLVNLEAEGRQLVTRDRIRSRPASAPLLARLPSGGLRPDDPIGVSPAGVAPHPWQLASPEPEVVPLGPGVVAVPETRVYAPHQTVEVAAGTRFEMGSNASLIFLGPVQLRGTSDHPIEIVPTPAAPEQRWGGIALLGPRTAGSTLRHVNARTGSRPRLDPIPFPGMVNVQDTERILIENCRFGQNGDSDDVVHVAYVRGLIVDGLVIEAAYSDAVDLEFTEASLRHVEIDRAGDECLDLMGSQVSLSDSVLLRCLGNGLSAGEESRVIVSDTLVGLSRVGVQAKNASRVQLADSLLVQNSIGVRVVRGDWAYEGQSLVEADVLFVVDSERPVVRKDQDAQTLDLGRIQSRLPQEDGLEHLLYNVLRLASWDDLASFLARSEPGRTP